MANFFELCVLGLGLSGLFLYLHRRKYENPPHSPYLVIVLTTLSGYWIATAGAPIAGTVFLVAAGFLLVHLASQPFVDTEGL